jgi:heme-degrading monooxygenase HmoA
MIARHWRGVAHADTADAYLDHLRRSTLPEIREISGFRGAYVLRGPGGDEVEFVVITLWNSRESVETFAGQDLEAAVVPDEARRLLARFDERVELYDVAFSSTAPGA